MSILNPLLSVNVAGIPDLLKKVQAASRLVHVLSAILDSEHDNSTRN